MSVLAGSYSNVLRMCVGLDTHFVDEGERGNHNSGTCLQLQCAVMLCPSRLGPGGGDKH